MTYVVKKEYIKCKLFNCIEVYPVDCFYKGKYILIIKPDECIDCGVCEPECPIDAIKPDINKKRILLLMPIITEMKKINMRNFLKKI